VATNLVISGGPLHDFAASTGVLVDALGAAGVRSTVLEDPHDALRRLADQPRSWDMVTVNALRWQAGAARHAHLREEWSFSLTDAESRAVDRYVRDGGSLLACHAAVICFDGDARWVACLGATWDWNRSTHPPLGPTRIDATAAGADHPLTAGIDGFDTVDEVYGFLELAPDLVPLLTGAHGGVDHPVLWERRVGRGRVVVDLLGHDAAAMGRPEHREVLRRAAQLLTERRADASVGAHVSARRGRPG
jgi:type 1 glutamine amidotransferase